MIGHHLTNVDPTVIAREGLLMCPPVKEYDCKDGVYVFTSVWTAWGWNFPSGSWRDAATREYEYVCVVNCSSLDHEIDELICDNEAVRVLQDVTPERIHVMAYMDWEAKFLPRIEHDRKESA